MICRNIRVSFRTYGFSRKGDCPGGLGCLKFVGIDLAWGEHKPSGVAVIEADGSIARASAQPRTNNEIFQFAALDASDGAVVAIDAPLTVRNTGKCRPVEQQLTDIFWPYDAGPFPANLSNPAFQPGARIARLLERLEGKSFVQRTSPVQRQEQRTLIEVFPSPAQVILFPGQNRLQHLHCKGLRCKPKRDRPWAEVHSQWEIYRARLRSLQYGNPAVKFAPEVNHQIGIEIIQYTGSKYKQFDDLLDGIFCAYLAYYFWYWGSDRSWVIGDLETGCVTLPTCDLPNCPLKVRAPLSAGRD